MILINLELRGGGLVSFNAAHLEAIFEEDGFAAVQLTSGRVWVSNINEPREVETGELEVVKLAGVDVRRPKKVMLSPRELLRGGIFSVLQQAGQAQDVRNRLTAPGVVGQS